ncbi:MAG TPA: hypothetical protein DCQ64_22275 [Candidatus Rokubacteria bacterium]|nr:hypothetical protein [Candidatus Rokubacteria bacterium]
MAVATGAKSFNMMGLEQRLPSKQVGAPYVVQAKKATGTITCVAKADLIDAETITISDGTNTPTVFEFDVNGTGVTAGRVQVDVSGATTAADVGTILHTAINGVTTTLLVVSVDNLDGTLDLTNASTGAAGNVVITETVVAAGFLVTGMAGGVDENFGLSQVLVRPGAVITRKPVWGNNDEFTGSLESPEKPLVGWAYSVELSQWLRTGPLVMQLASMLGEPVVVQDGASNAWQYTFPLTDDPDASVSLWDIHHKAGSTNPLLTRAIRINEIEVDAPERGESAMKAKGLACGWTEHGLGDQDAANTGTSPCGAALTGPRTDTNKYVDALKFKVSVVATAGIMKVTVALGSGTYSTAELSIPYSTVTGLQTAWVEVVDDAGPLGLDDCEDGLEPLMVFLSGDLRLYAVDDVLSCPALLQIPGDEAGQTGVARDVLSGPRFGPAHVVFNYGATTASDSLDFQVGTFSLKRTIKESVGRGRNARNPGDLDVTDYLEVEASITRKLDSRTWERYLTLGVRPVGELRYDGCLIAGSTSGWRESLVVTLPQLRPDDIQSPVSGSGNVIETLKLSGERARSGTAMTVVVRSGTHIDFSVC